MTFKDLAFTQGPCCGAHRAAGATLSDGRQATVYEQEGGLYTVAIMRDGILAAPLLRDLAPDQVDAAIA